jgi:hypothetical protein
MRVLLNSLINEGVQKESAITMQSLRLVAKGLKTLFNNASYWGKVMFSCASIAFLAGCAKQDQYVVYTDSVNLNGESKVEKWTFTIHPPSDVHVMVEGGWDPEAPTYRSYDTCTIIDVQNWECMVHTKERQRELFDLGIKGHQMGRVKMTNGSYSNHDNRLDPFRQLIHQVLNR